MSAHCDWGAASGGEPLEPGVVHLWIRAANLSPLRPPPATSAALNRRSQQDLRNVLERYRHPLPPLSKAEGGKPFLPGGPQFNLSHSAGGTAIAVSSGAVGVDIEGLSRNPDSQGIARKYFFPHEISTIEQSPCPQESFLRHWVSKEAMAKLAGEGIYRGLREAEVIGLPASPCGLYRARPAHITFFGSAALGLTGAVATWDPVRVKIFVPWPISDSMAECHSKI